MIEYALLTARIGQCIKNLSIDVSCVLYARTNDT